MTTLARTAYRRKLPHLQNGTRMIFISMSTKLRWLLPPAARDIVLSHIVRQHKTRMNLAAAVVMPDHAHLLFSPLEQERSEFTLPKIMHAIRGPSAHDVNRLLRRRGAVWEDEFFDRLLRDGEFDSTMSYICLNAVQRGLVREEGDYEWLWLPPEFGGEWEAAA